MDDPRHLSGGLSDLALAQAADIDSCYTPLTTIVFPPGRHLVTPRNKEHLPQRGLRNLVIGATSAGFVCGETTQAILIEECEDLSLRRLVIDCDPCFAPDSAELLPGHTRARAIADKPRAGQVPQICAQCAHFCGAPSTNPQQSQRGAKPRPRPRHSLPPRLAN